MATAKTTAPAKTAPAATKKVAAKAPAKAPVKTPAKAAAKAPVKAAPKAAAPAAAIKPVKENFTKAGLLAHVAAQSGVEAKVVKNVLAALDATILGALNKKGAGEFTYPGLLKISAQKVPARKAYKGIDPFTKQERTFAAKPASVKVKVRALKKLKDSAL